MSLLNPLRQLGQRGATLTGYALFLSTFTAVSLVAVDSLEGSSGEFLEDTGSSIGEPRESRDVLATIDLGTAPAWAPPPPSTTTTTAPPTSTTAPPSSSSTSSTAPTSSTSSTVPAPTYTETFNGSAAAAHSGKCLEASAGTVTQQPCTGAANQTISVMESSGGGSQLRVDGQCLAPPDVSQSSVIQSVPCVDGDPLQLWTQVGDSWVNSASGMCLDVSDASTADGTNLIQYGCHGADNQNFSMGGGASLVVDAASAVVTGDFVVSGGVLSVPNGTGSNWSGADNTTSTATFTFEVVDAGDYVISGEVNGVSGDDDSFYVLIDGGPDADGYLWDSLQSGGWGNDNVNDRDGADPVTVTLGPGTHTVTIALREDGSELKSLELVRV